jgi:hypothetical protein
MDNPQHSLALPHPWLSNAFKARVHAMLIEIIGKTLQVFRAGFMAISLWF